MLVSPPFPIFSGLILHFILFYSFSPLSISIFFFYVIFSACPWVHNIYLQLIWVHFKITLYHFTGSTRNLEYFQFIPVTSYFMSMIHFTYLYYNYLIYCCFSYFAQTGIYVFNSSNRNKKSNTLFIPFLTLFFYIDSFFDLYQFLSLWGTSFNIYYREGLLVTFFFQFSSFFFLIWGSTYFSFIL